MSRRSLHLVAFVFLLVLVVYVSLVAARGSLRIIPSMIVASVVIVGLSLGTAYVTGMLRYHWPAAILTALTLTGLVLTGAMTALSADTGYEAGWIDRVCRPEGHFNHCQQAFQSRWASLPLGFGPKAPRIPSVVAGTAFYSALLMWFSIMGQPTLAERRWHLVPLFLTAAGTAVAGFMTYVMFARLSGPCRLCLASHGITVLLLIGTVLCWPGFRWVRRAAGSPLPHGRWPHSPPEGLEVPPPVAVGPIENGPPWQRPVVTLLAMGVLCLLIVQVRVNHTLQRNVTQLAAVYHQIIDDPNYIRWDMDRQPMLPIRVEPDDSVRGPESAPYVVVTYGDFQCPQCKNLAVRLEEVRKAYPDRLRIVFRHFPLDRSCNPRTSTYMHAYSCQAALAGEAARLIGGNEAFWKMHDAIFAHQRELDERPYEKLAAQIGLDPVRFAAEMNGRRVWERLRAQIEGSSPFEVANTPAVFLNGRRVRQWDSMAFWHALLAATSSQPTSGPTTSAPVGLANCRPATRQVGQ